MIAIPVALLACCNGSGPAVTGSPNPTPAGPTGTPTASNPAPSCTLDVSRWSVERLAGAVLTAPAKMADLPSLAGMVSSGIGGILLFGLPPADLSTQLAQLARAAGSWPLLVSSDEEGGGIQRLGSVTGSLPWARDLAHRSPIDIRAMVRTVAGRMRAVGVRVDLAPVADLDAGPGPDAQHPDGKRSFSSDASTATSATIAFARGLLDAGVIPVIKHFPGLGTAKGNTDEGAATTAPLSALRTRDLLPFVAAINDGLPAVMTSNAIVPGLSGQPVSISADATTRMLREELHFNGVVFTDSLSAKAIADAGLTVPQAAVQAIQAGADNVIFGKDDTPDPPALAASVRAALVAAVESRQISSARLRTSVVRLATMVGARTC